MIVKKTSVGNLQENCYIVGTEQNNCAIVDPGEESKKVLDKIRTLGLEPKIILLTHGHYDHIGAVLDIMNAFPHLKVYIGENEKKVVNHHAKQSNTEKVAEFIIENAIEVKDGDVIELDELKFAVMQTPGHTHGGVVYTVNDRMFSGDTLFYGTVGRCDLYTSNYGEMIESLKKIYSEGKNYIVYPGHEQETSLDKEKQINKYVQEALGI